MEKYGDYLSVYDFPIHSGPVFRGNFGYPTWPASQAGYRSISEENEALRWAIQGKPGRAPGAGIAQAKTAQKIPTLITTNALTEISPIPWVVVDAAMDHIL